MNKKKNNYVSLRIIEAKRKGNRITLAKRVKIGILNGILILVPKGFCMKRKLSAPMYATQSSKFLDY